MTEFDLATQDIHAFTHVTRQGIELLMPHIRDMLPAMSDFKLIKNHGTLLSYVRVIS